MEDSSLSEGETYGETEAEEGRPSTVKKRAVRFSKAQKACLNAYYCQGMTGAAKENAHLIAQAVKDTHLTSSQVKVS